MKKIVFTLAMIMATFVLSAQVFVGGSVGIDNVGVKGKAGNISSDLFSNFTYQLAPKVGYHLDDKLSIGLYAGIIGSNYKRDPDFFFNFGDSGYDDYFEDFLDDFDDYFDFDDLFDDIFDDMFDDMFDELSDSTADIEEKETTWSFGAFARYNLISKDRLALLLEGNLGISGISSSTTVGKKTIDGDPTTIFELQVMPVISYSLSERINLEASSDFLRFGFMSETEKDNNDKNNKTKRNHFGLGANSSATNFLGQINSPLFKIGLVVNF